MRHHISKSNIKRDRELILLAVVARGNSTPNPTHHVVLISQHTLLKKGKKDKKAKRDPVH